MPNRTIRPEILTSERVDKLGAHAEVFYRRLMSVVDDFGRFSAHLSVLRAAVYPLRLDKVREADISRLLTEVQQAGLIALYAVDGKQYLELFNLRDQRAKTSKYPPPPASASICEQTQASVPITYSITNTITNTVSEDSSEPSKRRSKRPTPPPEDLFLEFPVVGDPSEPTWWLTHTKANEYRQSYPGVNVDSEARKALQWLRDNKSKQKTANGMARFLNSWMARTQDDGRTTANRPSSSVGREQAAFQGSINALSQYAAEDNQHGVFDGDGPPVRIEANGSF